MTTINNHMTGYWLQAMQQLAATKHSLRDDYLPIPPEIVRLHTRAIENFAHCSTGHSFRDFEDACRWASEFSQLASLAVGPRTITVCRLTMTDFRADQKTDFCVYPDDSIPMAPGYIKVEPLTRFTSTQS